MIRALAVLPLAYVAACGCPACDWTSLCIAVASLMAAALFGVLSLVHELQMLASIWPRAGAR
jgi:hypothetical protein